MAIYIYSGISAPGTALTFPFVDLLGDVIVVDASDYLSLTANSTNDDISIENLSYVGTVSAGDGNDIVSINSSTVVYVYGNGDADSLYSIDADIYALFGGTGGDYIEVTGSTLDILYGEDGADIIVIDNSTLYNVYGGNDGDDIDIVDSTVFGDVDGGAGADTIDISGIVMGTVRGGSDGDIITLDPNAITYGVDGGSGVDTLNLGGAIIGSVFGGTDGDTINIGSAKVAGLISGGDGSDNIVSGYFDDLISGGAGADIFYFGNLTGIDVITDFEDGVDLIDFTASDAQFLFQLDISQDGANTIIGHGENKIVLLGFTASDISSADFVGITNVLNGTPNNDALTLNAGETVDSVDGLGGNDSIFLVGGTSSGDVHGGEGNDFIQLGDPGNPNGSVIGGTGIFGDAGDDTINGGAADDTIIGGADNDTLSGGGGTDTAVFTGNLADYTREYVYLRTGGSDPADHEGDRTGSLTDTVGTEGTDTVADDIEWFQFDDGTYTWDEVFNVSAPVFTSGASVNFQENGGGVVYDANVTDADQPGADDDPSTAAAVGTPPDLGESQDIDVHYAITGGADELLFDINSATGEVTFKAAPDYEAPADVGGNNVYNIEITASDNVNSTATSVAITVTDANDHSPTITSGTTPASTSLNVAENAGGVVYDLNATDADPTDTITYAIAGGTDAVLFDINTSTGEISFVAAPDFETPTDSDTNNVYKIQVSASDGSNTVVQNVNITVTDLNDSAPVFTSGNAVNFAENGLGTVYDANTTDADTVGPAPVYSLSGPDAALFDINPANGIVTFKNPPDYETPLDVGGINVYNITVSAFDGVNTTPQAVAITVTDGVDNSSSPVFTSGTTANFAENGTGVAYDADATDGDGTNPTYFISGGADAALFTINGASGELTFLSPPDYETALDSDTDNVYDVEITATDGLNDIAQSVAITVTDVYPEVIVLNGTSGNDILTATSGDNFILNGQAGDDTLTGNAGNDIFNPGPGIDTMTGNEGADTFVIQDGDGRNVITDFDVSSGDVIDLSGISGVRDFADIVAASRDLAGGSTALSFPDGTRLILSGVEIGDMSADDFIFSVSPAPTASGFSDSSGSSVEDPGPILEGGPDSFSSSFKDTALILKSAPEIEHGYWANSMPHNWNEVDDGPSWNSYVEPNESPLPMFDHLNPFEEFNIVQDGDIMW